MSLQTRISDLITAVGTDYKQIRTWITGSSSGDLTGLTTTDKTSLLAAINEVDASVAGGGAAASETVAGIAELATQGETNTGTDDARIVTPLKLQTRMASYVSGFAQPLDSDLTAIAALTTTTYGRAFLALANQAALMALVPTSSETVVGAVELASLAETATGTDALRAVTAAGVRQERTALKAEILGAGVPGALDTLDELAAALADDANYAATITTALSNKQPLDTDLTAIAALVSAIDKVPYATGAGTWALMTVTTAARTLLDDVDVAAMRTTLSVYSQAELGNPETDLAALYTTAKA